MYPPLAGKASQYKCDSSGRLLNHVMLTVLFVPPPTGKTNIVYLLQPLDGNIPNALFIFGRGGISKNILFTLRCKPDLCLFKSVTTAVNTNVRAQLWTEKVVLYCLTIKSHCQRKLSNSKQQTPFVTDLRMIIYEHKCVLILLSARSHHLWFPDV